MVCRNTSRGLTRPWIAEYDTKTAMALCTALLKLPPKVAYSGVNPIQLAVGVKKFCQEGWTWALVQNTWMSMYSCRLIAKMNSV